MSGSNSDNTSTLKSYVDSAVGATQNVVGTIIGSRGDEVNLRPKTVSSKLD
jgi:hypothetical protein